MFDAEGRRRGGSGRLGVLENHRGIALISWHRKLGVSHFLALEMSKNFHMIIESPIQIDFLTNLLKLFLPFLDLESGC